MKARTYTLIALMPYVVMTKVFANTDSSITNSFDQKTPITSGVLKQSQKHASLAKKWRLKPEEYQRYTDLMQGPLRYWNPDIDPVLALGIYAKNTDEQRRYAELFAQQEHDLITRTQAFERAYHSAFNRLFPDAEVISDQLMKGYYQHKNNSQSLALNSNPNSTLTSKNPTGKRRYQLQANDRILYFSKASCKGCQRDVQQLLTLQTQHPSLFIDFYLLDVDNEDKVRGWASEQKINSEKVRSGGITLNIDIGTFDAISQGQKQTSRFYLSRDQQLFSIKPVDIYLR